MNRNKMTEIANRGLLTKTLADNMLKEQVKKEFKSSEALEAIKDYLLENPIELIKSMYIVSDGRFIINSDVNDKQLVDITFEEHLADLDINVEIALLNIHETIKLNNELHIKIVDKIDDSGDSLGFALDLYEYDAQYFDNWVYGDAIRLSNIACETECIEFFTSIFNSIKPEIIYSTVYAWIKSELGFEVPVFEIKEDVTLVNSTDARRNKLASRLKDMSDKVSRMTDEDFNSYEELIDSVSGEISECEDIGMLDDSLGQLDEEFAALLFFNCHKGEGYYTVK